MPPWKLSGQKKTAALISQNRRKAAIILFVAHNELAAKTTVFFIPLGSQFYFTEPSM
ncbi:MAG TPA: hypothetical protein GXX74_00850 [Clostridiales bacterium]|nr:hypothetical protein [Clostridiales bacterium]